MGRTRPSSSRRSALTHQLQLLLPVFAVDLWPASTASGSRDLTAHRAQMSTAPPLTPILTTGEITTMVRGEKRCLTANTSAACRPNGSLLPPRPPVASVCAVHTRPCDSSPAQVWRLSAVGEIESNLTRDGNHSMCLDGGDGAVAVYTNWCVRNTSASAGGWAQLWHWSTVGSAGPILLALPHTCATASAENLVVLAACTANNQAWTLPASGPLPPLPPAPPPPAPPPAPCPSIKLQNNCTSTHGRCVWKTGHCVIPPAVPWPPPPPPREHPAVCLSVPPWLASDVLFY